MNKKKSGFTLIELLAVIIILAVIALIATPIIMNVINDSKKGAFKDSAYGIIKALELKHSTDILSNKGLDNELIDLTSTSLDYSGEKPDKGSAAISADGKIAIEMNNKNHCITKGFDDDDITITSKTTACDGSGLASINLFPFNKWNLSPISGIRSTIEWSNNQIKFISTTGLDAMTDTFAYDQSIPAKKINISKYGFYLEPGNKYNFSVETDATKYQLFIFFLDQDMNNINISYSTDSDKSFTVPEGTKYVTVRIDNEMGAGSTPTFKNMKISRLFE